MIIEKATQILKSIGKELLPPNVSERHQAVNLGIKALQRFDNLRAAGHYVGMPLLKGETPKK